MFAARSPGLIMGGRPPITPLVFKNFAETTSGSVLAHPTGLVDGDLVLIVDPYGTGGGPRTLRTNGVTLWNTAPLAWNLLGYTSCLHWKFVDSVDRAGTWDLSVSGSFGCKSFAFDAKGATALNVISAVSSTAYSRSNLNIPGYIKSSDNRDTLSVVIDRDPDSLIGAPTGFTIHHNNDDPSHIFRTSIAQKSAYVSGDAIVWTGLLGTNGYPEAGFAIEVL